MGLVLGQGETWAWVAGVLDAEGSFEASRPSKPRTPRVAVEMTDEDVVRRLGRLLGRAIRYRDRGQKPSYTVTVQGVPALKLMLTVRPYLCSRRQARIDAILAACRNEGVNVDAVMNTRFELAPHCYTHLCGSAMEQSGLCTNCFNKAD